MRVSVLSVPVLNQEQALKFYTEILGFVKKLDIPVGNDSRWLTVVSPDDQEGTQVLLEPAPIHHEPTKVYQQSLLESGIPWTQFDVDDVEAEYDRLSKLGVEFSMKPTVVGTSKVVVFKDTCGNNLQLVEAL